MSGPRKTSSDRAPAGRTSRPGGFLARFRRSRGGREARRSADPGLPPLGAEDPQANLEDATPTLASGPHVGAALRMVREHRGLSLEDLSQITRVRGVYLAAIESMRLELLPSRPFTIGYIRAYAQALALDGDAAVARFKFETPEPDARLRAPLGVGRQRDPRLTALAVGCAFIIGAIVLWNLAQRGLTEDRSAPPPTAARTAPPPQPAGLVRLGPPVPPPLESTTPDPYETPGLAEATAVGGSADAAEAAAKARAEAGEAPVPEPAPVLMREFRPAGPVQGAPPGQGRVALLALRSVSLIIRGPDGSVYFARQLSAGQAYRAPLIAGLVAEASNPAHVQVFIDGQSRGLLAGPAVQVNRLLE